MFDRVCAQFGFIVCSLTFFSALKGTSGSGKVTVLLKNYANSKSQLADGSCCDNLNWCIADCDNFFQLCFALISSSDKCALWKGWTKVFNSDGFTFPGAGGSLGNGITNPVTYSFTRWQAIVFDVEVWDNDDGSIIGAEKDFVDRYSLTIQTNPYPNFATATVKRHQLTGQGSSYLNVDVKVFCDSNYFIPDCSTYCVSRNDNTGHYTCDYARGQKVCLSGWYGSDCLTYCVFRNDTLGHYSCDGNGKRQCLDYWYGQDCLVYCKPRNDSQGHFTCNGTGHVDCLPGWRGENCTEVNATRPSIAVSLATSMGLAPTATRGSDSSSPSSLYFSPQSSISVAAKPSSRQSSRTVVAHHSFFSKDRSDAFTSSVSRGMQIMLTKFDSGSYVPTSTVHTTFSFLTAVWPNTSDVSESFSVPRRSADFFVHPSLVSTSSELRDFERTDTTKPVLFSKHATTSRLVNKSSALLKLSHSSPQTNAPFLVSKTTILPLFATEKHATPKVTEITRMASLLTRHHRSSRREHLLSLTQILNFSSNASSAETATHTQLITPHSISSLCATDKSCTSHRTLRSQNQASSSQEFSSPSISSSQMAEPTTLTSKASLGSVCAVLHEEVIMTSSAAKREEKYSIAGAVVQFQPVKEDDRLAVPWVVKTIKTVLAQQLNIVCRENAEDCNFSDEEMHSVRFCPWDVTVEIKDVTTEGAVAFKITSTLPPPLNGKVPTQTLLEVLKKSKEDLERTTQATINWIQVYGLTTPRSYEKSDLFARFSPRQKTSPLPYIIGIVGAGLTLVVVLLVARARRARSRVYPRDEDEIPSSPSHESQPDTIVLLSRTTAEYACKEREKVSLKDDSDVQPPGSVDENCL